MSWDIFSKSKIQYFLQKLKDKFVQKETGKGLSTNDYTTTDKNKVSKIDTTTTSISGNPISISGLKANQLAKNPIITLEPIQAGSGTPSPSNIRAISGYDKIEVLTCGKNLFDGTYSVTNAFLQSDNNEYPSNNWNISQYIPVKANTAYYFSNLSGATSARICWYNQAKEFISATSITEGFTATSPTNAFYVRASVRNDRTNVCINEGSSAITYEDYHKTTDLSESLGQTVYGGTLDVRTGKFTVTHKLVDLGDYTWSINTSSVYAPYFYTAVNDVLFEGAPSATVYSAKCTQYNIVARSQGYFVDGTLCFDGTTTEITQIQIRDNRYSTTSDFDTGVTGQKLCYKLKTPFTIQLTPHEISLLKDYAYLSTNGTSIALDYHNGELASLADVAQLSESVENQINYLENYIGASNANTAVDMSTTAYKCPCDGYLVVDSGTVTSGSLRIQLLASSASYVVGNVYMNITGAYQAQTTYIKKGMYIRVINDVTGTRKQFIPLY